MQFVHHISIASSADVQAELAQLGIVVDSKGLASFDVDESQESWLKMQRWIAVRKPVDIVSTKFSKQEIGDADWLELMPDWVYAVSSGKAPVGSVAARIVGAPDWHHGYPQPNENEFGYRAATYDLSNYCLECGTGMRQRAPFQMRAEPKWDRKEILQLNWVFDEYFVTPELWVRVFEPLGIASREVLGVTNLLESRTILQKTTS